MTVRKRRSERRRAAPPSTRGTQPARPRGIMAEDINHGLDARAAILGRLREACEGQRFPFLERVARAMHDAEAAPGGQTAQAWESDETAQRIWVTRARHALRVVYDELRTPHGDQPSDSIGGVGEAVHEREWTEA